MGSGVTEEVIGADMYNAETTGEVSMTLTAIRSDPHHVPCVVIIDRREDDEQNN